MRDKVTSCQLSLVSHGRWGVSDREGLWLEAKGVP